jgi:hypothetical protein
MFALFITPLRVPNPLRVLVFNPPTRCGLEVSTPNLTLLRVGSGWVRVERGSAEVCIGYP